MTQLYRFTDDNGVTRLEARQVPDPVPTSGSLVPVANASGVTVDSTTYADNIKGGGAKLTTLVFPTEQGALAMAILGDAFPRMVWSSDITDYGVTFGDGTVDPPGNGPGFSATASTLKLGAQATGITLQSPTFLSQVSALSTAVARRDQVSPVGTITSGALPTVQLVTATGAQISTTRDAETVTPCTFNPGAATTATVTVALSPDNVTYSTLAVVTEPVGVALDGTILPVKVRVPASWYLKLTVNAQAVLGVTTYY